MNASLEKKGNIRNSPASIRHVLHKSKIHQAVCCHFQKKNAGLAQLRGNELEGGGQPVIKVATGKS